MRLLDVNVLVAKSLEAHVHHRAVCEWFKKTGNMPFATCALTESSLLRLLMNPSINEQPIDAVTGIALLKQLHKHSRHRYIENLPKPGDPMMAKLLQRVEGYRQVTDAYLVGIAHLNGGKLATLDHKLRRVFDPDLLEVIDLE